MATNQESELIWQGRIHLGDEPGVYGDAHYAGLCAELPVTIFRRDPAGRADLLFTLVVEAEGVRTFTGYEGHEIVVVMFEPDPDTPCHSVERILIRDRLEPEDNGRKELAASTGTNPGPLYLGVRIRIDTTVNPGLYDDFIWKRLSCLASELELYAAFGFRHT
jgi:hypothetical protein